MISGSAPRNKTQPVLENLERLSSEKHLIGKYYSKVFICTYMFMHLYRYAQRIHIYLLLRSRFLPVGSSGYSSPGFLQKDPRQELDSNSAMPPSLAGFQPQARRPQGGSWVAWEATITQRSGLWLKMTLRATEICCPKQCKKKGRPKMLG